MCPPVEQKGHESGDPTNVFMSVTPWSFSQIMLLKISCLPRDSLQQYPGLMGEFVIPLNSSGSNLISQHDCLMPELRKNKKNKKRESKQNSLDLRIRFPHNSMKCIPWIVQDIPLLMSTQKSVSYMLTLTF